MHKNLTGLHVINETDELILGHIYEDTYLVSKQSGEYVLEDTFYGDPTCGCISPNNNWAVVAGEHITIWSEEKGITALHMAELQWVAAI
jgi:hypothetical protein